MKIRNSDIRNGFSLLEVTITLTIIGLITTASVYSLRDRVHYKVQSSVRSVSHLLLQSKRSCATHRIEQNLFIDFTNKSIGVCRHCDQPLDPDMIVSFPQSVQFKELSTETNIFTEGIVYLIINNMGIVQPAELTIAYENKRLLLRVLPFMPSLQMSVEQQD